MYISSIWYLDCEIYQKVGFRVGYNDGYHYSVVEKGGIKGTERFISAVHHALYTVYLYGNIIPGVLF